MRDRWTDGRARPVLRSIKRMTDDRQSWPILSANKNGQQKSAVSHAQIGRFCRPIRSSDYIVQHRTRSILDDEIGQRFGYRSLWWLFTVGDKYLF